MITYMQTDKRWKDVSYSVPGEKTTIGRAGCGTTCAAMVVENYIKNGTTPIQASQFSLDHGYKAKGGGTYVAFFPTYFETFGIKSKIVWLADSKSLKQAETALKDGDWVIACMAKGTWTTGTGHYVLAYKLVDNIVYIADPASTKTARTRPALKTWLSQIKYFVVIHNPLTFYQEKFIRSCQKACGMKETGKADIKLLDKTETISLSRNQQSKFTIPIQTYLKDIGYYDGKCLGFYDGLTSMAVKEYQKNEVGLKNPDGIITEGNKTWKKLLDLS